MRKTNHVVLPRVMLWVLPPAFLVLGAGFSCLHYFFRVFSNEPCRFPLSEAFFSAAVLIGAVYTAVCLTVKPLSGLIHRLERINNNDGPYYYVCESGPLELQQLAQSLNNLLQDLKSARASRDELSRIVFSMHASLFVISRDGIISMVNRAACTLLDYDREELVGKPVLKIFDLKDLNGFLAGQSPLETMPEGGQLKIETTLRSRSGEEVPVLLSSSFIFDMHGEITEMVCVAQGVALQKTVKEAMRKAHDTLAAQFEEQARHLRETESLLTARTFEAGITQLCTTLLHNIGNVLTPMRVYLENMNLYKLDQMTRYLDKSFTELTDHRGDLQHFINEEDRGRSVWHYMAKLIPSLGQFVAERIEIQNKIVSAADRVFQILDIQQSLSVGEEEVKELVDINSLVKDAVVVQTGSLAKREIIVRYDLETSLPRIFIDRARLLHLFVSLIGNSCEAFGRVKDEVRTEKVVLLKTAMAGDSIMVKVAVDNPGIELEEPGKSKMSGETSRAGGSLDFYRQYLESCGGEIAFGSDGQDGVASIAVTLPVSEPARACA